MGCWMETGQAGIPQAKEFADDVHSYVPHLMLAYNNSPSFNWDKSGMSDDQMKTFIWDLAKMGFCWQFITLAGFHMDSLGISLFARAYKKDGMKAYVQMIQRQEREHGVETLTHQKWSGAQLVDSYLNTVTSGKSSTDILGALKNKPDALRKWYAQCHAGMGLPKLRELAASLGAGDMYFDWDLARTIEG